MNINCKIINGPNGNSLDCSAAQNVIVNEGDAMELIAYCIENDVRSVLLHEHSLSPDFFRLSTGLAGQTLQKLQLYGIKLELVMEDQSLLNGRFGELALELNKGGDVRIHGKTA